MSIRLRIVFIVLPLLITSLLIAQMITSLSARNGITSVATEFLRFKSEELNTYGENQWNMLVENDLANDPEFVDITKIALESFAKSLVRSESELIFATNSRGDIVMNTSDISLSDDEQQRLTNLMRGDPKGWHQLSVGGTQRVAWITDFTPFQWSILITEARETFYKPVNDMLYQTIIVLIVASGISVVLLLLFTHYLTLPLQKVVEAMREIIKTNDLSKRVDIIYKDETGELAHSFNLMTEELQKAYEQIKGYALQAVVAQHKEKKIRNIFQKYVPKDVIDQFFTNPEAMLVGEDRELAILFSDIRSFTTISEQLLPNELVESLNMYFSRMVEIIMGRNGIVDKYIGDAIMSFFGAPVKHEDDALQATLAAIDMIESLDEFNQLQQKAKRPEFKIGIGINFGMVTVGNIGSERKMDYTVIGDMVNLASRLEGLTKKYKEPLIVSESVYNQISNNLHCRLVDKVIVKGKSRGIGIYAPKQSLTENEKKGWELYHNALSLYYKRDFSTAASLLTEVQSLLPGDRCSALFLDRCREYLDSPPPEDWTGVTVMSEK